MFYELTPLSGSLSVPEGNTSWHYPTIAPLSGAVFRPSADSLKMAILKDFDQAWFSTTLRGDRVKQGQPHVHAGLSVQVRARHTHTMA